MNGAPRATADHGAAKPKRRRAPTNGHAGKSFTGTWRDRLIYGRDGPRDCVANVLLVLRDDPCFAGELAYDELKETTVAGSMPWHATVARRPWTDRDDVGLAEWCQLRGLIARPSTCAAAVQHVAEENRVNDLRDRLDGLEWDGVERLSAWLTAYMGVEETDYSRAVGRAWMISAIARAMQPGCQADAVLILEGLQGVGKSTACSVLALNANWFAAEVADLTSKDAAQGLKGKWIIELGELSAMKRGQVERTKSFISARFDTYRPSYGRRALDFARRCVFIGSTNADAYLTDPTGNRRFWPVKVGTIDLDALSRDVEQLWAEAVAAFLDGERWHLDRKLEAVAAVEQEDRTEDDPWTEPVLAWAERVPYFQSVLVGEPTYQRQEQVHIDRVTIAGALEYALGIEKGRHDQRASTRVGCILCKAGWKQKPHWKDGKSGRHYLPPETSHSSHPDLSIKF